MGMRKTRGLGWGGSLKLLVVNRSLQWLRGDYSAPLRVAVNFTLLPLQASAAKAGALILEAVPVVREAMLRGKSWPAVAQRAAKEHFGDAAARMARERIEAMVKVG